MNLQRFAFRTTAAAVSLALLHLGYAQAQEAAPGASAPTADAGKLASSGDALELDAIVVTGTTEGVSKMNSSVSISTMDADQIQDLQPTSATDILRSIPGIHAEASSGSSNANVTVRGIPLSAGGSRYMLFEEDGLPILQIGDLNFLTPDSYIRTDSVTERVEAVRGGSGSTLATNAPGGIINFISKTGDTEETNIGLTEGVNFKETRYDFGKGGAIGPKTHYYIGGFYREGNGSRDGGVDIEHGGQIRANVTQTLENGYIRVSLKELDDRTPTNLPVPVRTVGGNIQPLAGIDPRTASFYSPYLLPDAALNSNNTSTVSNVNDGFSAKSSAIGAEASLNLGRGWKLEERFRYASNSGHFLGVYNGGSSAGAAGEAPAPAGTTYLTGPNAGKAYTGNAFTAVVFNTNINDASLTANDLQLARHFSLGGQDNMAATAGLYTSSQRVGMTWNFNQYLLEANGNKPAVLSSSINGTSAFGGCCQRVIDATYQMASPYLNVTGGFGALNVDAGVRRDAQTASGYYSAPSFASGAPVYSPSLTVTPAGANNPSGAIDYSVAHTSYSLGGNYRIAQPLSLFARYSDGVSFNGDRQAWGAGPVDGGPVPINEVKQLEGGVKLHAGDASLFLTLFQARISESNYDLTTQITTANHYLSNGAEVEAGYVVGNVRLNGGVTLTNAKITSALKPATIGTTPDRQAHAVYQGAVTYDLGTARAGVNFAGTSASSNSGNTLPGYVIVNAFVRYPVVPSTVLTVGVNNLFNQLAYTESDGAGNARALDGRTIKAGIAYSF